MSIVDPVPYSFADGAAIIAGQFNSNFSAIIANVNARAAASGANSDITSLSGLTALTVSGALTGGSVATTGAGSFGSVAVTGAITAGGTVTAGALSTTGNLNVGGGVAITGSETVGGNWSVTGTATVGGTLTVTGNISTPNSANVTGNVNCAGQIRTGGAVADTVYSGPGSLILSYGSAVRATNTVSSRLSQSNSGGASTFNLTNAAHPSTGVYTYTFVQSMQNTAYQVLAGAAFSVSGSLVFPVVSSKTTAGFTLSFYSAAGTLTDISSGSSDVIVTGGQ